ncbi:hypothetical protein BJV74DRAFT_968761 [Russula compacta]|nr:hypothetical protein BJV74DRAFT_968761 [Russula compacta]
MSTAEAYKLICLVEGDDTLFRVIASSTLSIIELKYLIKEECQYGVLRGIDTKDLTIWKADLPFPPKNERKHLTGKNAQESVQLEETDDISDHWPVTSPPPLKRLHIIVEVPSDRSASASESLPGTPPAETRDLWPTVTINATAQGNFGGPAAVERNKIFELDGIEPDFLQEFRTKLEQRRWIEPDTAWPRVF